MLSLFSNAIFCADFSTVKLNLIHRYAKRDDQLQVQN